MEEGIQKLDFKQGGVPSCFKSPISRTPPDPQRRSLGFLVKDVESVAELVIEGVGLHVFLHEVEKAGVIEGGDSSSALRSSRDSCVLKFNPIWLSLYHGDCFILLLELHVNITTIKGFETFMESLRNQNFRPINGDSGVDLVLSCVDNYEARMVVNQACNALNQIWMESGSSKWHCLDSKLSKNDRGCCFKWEHAVLLDKKLIEWPNPNNRGKLWIPLILAFQVASGRFGVTPTFLVDASQLEIKIAQGAKPGDGGQSATINFDLHQVNPKAKVSVKLVAEAGIGTVASNRNTPVVVFCTLNENGLEKGLISELVVASKVELMFCHLWQ
ncbi:hypothetical protein NE237_029754 [Protea cynaroides]|uniref:Uncharacterized protein n=1 Tax=Protea cynaroides TaxID=273540 RepID=A0A9Q0JVE5_9MAGN|nr:hypothetical protein NE237_029754 [Protea cynaroides]